MYREQVLTDMRKVFQKVPYGIEHTLQVLQDAETIMEGEHIPRKKRELIVLAAILHDIGAVEAQRKYGSMEACYQEAEGPAVAREILLRAGYHSEGIDRICYIVGNHHTPSKIDDVDFRIVWEADLLAGLPYMEIRKDPSRLRGFIETNFITATGKALAYRRYITP